MSELNELIGLTIKSIVVADDKESMQIFTEDNLIANLQVHGDCCSTSWIEHVETPNYLQGAKIISIDEKQLREDEEIEYSQIIQFYGVTIKTTKGDIDIEYRNESNGYYSGWMTLEIDKVEEN